MGAPSADVEQYLKDLKHPLKEGVLHVAQTRTRARSGHPIGASGPNPPAPTITAWAAERADGGRSARRTSFRSRTAPRQVDGAASHVSTFRCRSGRRGMPESNARTNMTG